MNVNSNYAAMLSLNSMAQANSKMATAAQRLSTGLRINSAADDAAGMAVGEKMKSQINGMNQAVKNLESGIDMFKVADSTMGEVQDVLQRMRELSVQAANGTLTDSDREFIQMEITELTDYIDGLMNGTQFNKIKLFRDDNVDYFTDSIMKAVDIYNETLLDGEEKDETTTEGLKLSLDGLLSQDLSTDELYQHLFTAFDLQKYNDHVEQVKKEAEKTGDQANVKKIYIQAGANEEDQIGFTLKNMSARILGIADLDLSTQEKASKAISKVDGAIKKTSEQRAMIGAQINRMEHQISYLSSGAVNLENAKSRIMDADMPTEMLAFTQANIQSEMSGFALQGVFQIQRGVLNLFA